MLPWFGFGSLPHCYDLNSFLIYAMNFPLSAQFTNFWRLGVVSTIWAIWSERNLCTFEDKQASYFRILAFVKAAILEAAVTFSMGFCSNTWKDYTLGRALGISCNFSPPKTFCSVTWWPPLPAWIKVNTDGSADGSPGRITAGGVFRDAAGVVRGCFHVNGGRGFAFEAEILAAVTAIEIVYVRGWHFLWLETDSTYVALLLETRSTAVPWRFANSWRMALNFLNSMEFRVSHIFREGNQAADIMARLDTPDGWWPHCISLIFDATKRDMAYPCFYRVV